MNLYKRDHYVRLLEDLRSAGTIPERIVHVWGGQLAADPSQPREIGFYSLMWLAQAIGTLPHTPDLRLDVVSDLMSVVAGREVIEPEKAMLTGACRVIGQEFPGMTTRCIDVPSLEARSDNLRRLLAELCADGAHPAVAYRNGIRYRLDYRRVELIADRRATRVRPRGVYLITGGLGGIGLALAEHLAETAGARLVLTGRSALPDRTGWAQWLDEHDSGDAVSARIRQVLELERLGAEVLVAGADVSDPEQVRALAARVGERFGPVNGIIHSAGVAGGGIIQLRKPESGPARPGAEGRRHTGARRCFRVSQARFRGAVLVAQRGPRRRGTDRLLRRQLLSRRLRSRQRVSADRHAHDLDQLGYLGRRRHGCEHGSA